jgi:hypothetical protein
MFKIVLRNRGLAPIGSTTGLRTGTGIHRPFIHPLIIGILSKLQIFDKLTNIGQTSRP